MKLLHVRRVTNAQAYALGGFVTSRSVLDGEFHHIVVVRIRLLTPLSEALPDPKSEGVCSVGMVTKPIEV